MANFIDSEGPAAPFVPANYSSTKLYPKTKCILPDNGPVSSRSPCPWGLFADRHILFVAVHCIVLGPLVQGLVWSSALGRTQTRIIISPPFLRYSAHMSLAPIAIRKSSRTLSYNASPSIRCLIPAQENPHAFTKALWTWRDRYHSSTGSRGPSLIGNTDELGRMFIMYYVYIHLSSLPKIYKVSSQMFSSLLPANAQA